MALGRGDVPGPGDASEVPALVLAACARVFRPLVRLALSLGLKNAQLQRLLSELMLDEGRRIWRAQGIEPNISQLSVTTGLNRKAVTLRVRAPDQDMAPAEMSAAAKTLTLWSQLQQDDASLASLPVSADGTALSFEVLARRASRGNLHHRAILDELVRLELVEEKDGQAVLRRASFIPANDLRSMLSLLGNNTHDHLAAAVSNVLHRSEPMLERAIYARGLKLEDCAAIEAIVRTRWATLHHELAEHMTAAVEAGESAGSGTARMRVGIYTFMEPTDVDPPLPRKKDAPSRLDGGLK